MINPLGSALFAINVGSHKNTRMVFHYGWFDHLLCRDCGITSTMDEIGKKFCSKRRNMELRCFECTHLFDPNPVQGFMEIEDDKELDRAYNLYLDADHKICPECIMEKMNEEE